MYTEGQVFQIHVPLLQLCKFEQVISESQVPKNGGKIFLKEELNQLLPAKYLDTLIMCIIIKYGYIKEWVGWDMENFIFLM